MSDIVDLDALLPKPTMIKFAGADIAIDPPKTADVIRLGFLSQKLQDAGSLPTEELDVLLADLTNQVYKTVPQLAGRELSMAQLMKLIEIIGSMAIPPDAKELEAKGITADNSKKDQ